MGFITLLRFLIQCYLNHVNLSFLLFPVVKDASNFCKDLKIFPSSVILYQWLFMIKNFFLFRRKITNIPWTPYIMLIKFLSLNHSVCQGKGQPSILRCSVGWLPCRHGINGRLLAGHPVLHPPCKFILEKLPRHQTSSKLLLVENILRDLFYLLLEIMKSFRIVKVQDHTSVLSDLRVAGISWWLFSSSFLPF